MNADLGIGLLAIGWGLLTLFMRIRAPWRFRKLEPMKQRFGATLGSALHATAYIVLPLAAGVSMLVRGLRT